MVARIWFALAALCAGVYLAVDALPILLLLLLTGAGLLCLRRRAALRLVGLFALSFACGSLSAAARAHPPTAVETLASSVPRCRLEGRVVEQAGGLGTLIDVGYLSCPGWEPLADAGIAIVDGSQADAGAPVTGSALLIPLEREGFDLARRRAGALVTLARAQLRFGPVPFGLHSVAASVRTALRASTDRLDDRRAALLRGLTIGDTSQLDDVTIDRFRRAGLSHLLAVSGSNVAIVLAAVAFGARRAPFKLRLVLCSSALLLFVVVVGPDPSVLRAAAMAAIGLVGIASGRRAAPLNALGLALVVVIAARPALLFSVGLHLSVAATLGLVLWTHPLSRGLRSVPQFVALPLAATLAAQLAVAPIVIAVFGQLPLAGPLANLLALAAVPPATVLGLAAGVVGTFAPVAAGLIARATEPLTGWVLFIGDHFGAPTWAAVDPPRWSVPVTAVAVAVAVVRSLREVP